MSAVSAVSAVAAVAATPTDPVAPGVTHVAPVTHVYCLLDNSASMSGSAAATMTGVNQLITEQKEDEVTGSKMYFSAAFFSLEVAEIIPKQDIGDVQPLMTYSCSGGTALNDAICRTITRLERRTVENEKVLVYIFTDGCENASKHYTSEDARRMVEKKKEEGWEFTFMGANQDAYFEGGKYSINSCMTFEQSTTGISSCFEKMNAHMSSSKRGFSTTIESVETVEKVTGVKHFLPQEESERSSKRRK